MEEIITFRKPKLNDYSDKSGVNVKPTSFNGMVNIERYKITIEKLDEPKEIICERLEYLWTHESNFHQYEPLKEKAKELNYEFKGKFGESKSN